MPVPCTAFGLTQSHGCPVPLLQWVLNLDHTQGLPLLVVANKQDQPGAMTEVEVTQALGLAPDSGFVTGEHQLGQLRLGSNLKNSIAY